MSADNDIPNVENEPDLYQTIEEIDKSVKLLSRLTLIGTSSVVFFIAGAISISLFVPPSVTDVESYVKIASIGGIIAGVVAASFGIGVIWKKRRIRILLLGEIDRVTAALRAFDAKEAKHLPIMKKVFGGLAELMDEVLKSAKIGDRAIERAFLEMVELIRTRAQEIENRIDESEGQKQP